MKSFLLRNAEIISVVAILWTAAALKVFGGLPTNDVVNGALESCGGIFIFLSVRALHTSKLVRGVSWKHVLFFSIWGYWNPFYYSSLDQWFSFAGGVFLVVMNSIWLAQIAYYLLQEKKHVHVQ
jgi:hypothetical protein